MLAAGGFLAFDHFTPRMQRPEYGLAAAWLLAQVMIAASVAVSGGPHSPAVGWLAIPVASLGARFSRRGVVVGSLVTAVLLLAATVGVHPREVWDDPPVVLGPLALIGSIAFIGGAIMESHLLHRSRSVLDGLTGMLNRRALATRAEELGAQARVTGQPVGLVLGDLDHFKVINDTRGHATGDAVLVHVAYVLRKELRAFDLAYRVGGEEFLVVIPGGDESEARTLAERLRVAVEAEPAGGQRVTMSFGIASSGGVRSTSTPCSPGLTPRSTRPRPRGATPSAAAASSSPRADTLAGGTSAPAGNPRAHPDTSPPRAGASSSRPPRLALLEERRHPFLDVLRGERDRELRAQELPCVLERHVVLAPQGVLAQAHEHG